MQKPKETIEIPVATNLSELKGYLEQIIALIEKVENFKITAKVGEVPSAGLRIVK